jgi:hypothetical protein
MMLTDEQVDAALNQILAAAGSALRHYTMPKTTDDLRQAFRSAVEGLVAGQVTPAAEMGLQAANAGSNPAPGS